MKLLLQIGVVCGVYWASQCIEHVLPFSFPASVISLLLLLVLLLRLVSNSKMLLLKRKLMLYFQQQGQPNTR